MHPSQGGRLGEGKYFSSQELNPGLQNHRQVSTSTKLSWLGIIIIIVVVVVVIVVKVQQTLYWPGQEIEAARVQDNRHMKVVRLSALRTGRIYPPGNIPGTYLCCRLSREAVVGAAAAAAVVVVVVNNNNNTADS